MQAKSKNMMKNQDSIRKSSWTIVINKFRKSFNRQNKW